MKDKIIELVFLLILISTLGVFCFLLLKKIETKIKEITNLNQEIFVLQTNIRNLKKFPENQTEILENGIVRKDLPLPFVSFLEEEAKKTGVSIEIISSEGEKELYFKVKAKGPFLPVVHYLEKIEKGSFLNQFKSFSLKKEKTGAIEAEVVVKVFSK